MAQPLTERRIHSRFGQPTISTLKAVLRPGHQVDVVNLSAGGALIDGQRPLRPGSRVFLQITVGEQTGGRTAQVVRCTVAALAGLDGVQYRSAIKFDDHWETLWEQCTLDGYQLPVAVGEVETIDGDVLGHASDVRWPGWRP